jgi:hypothetical protein
MEDQRSWFVAVDEVTAGPADTALVVRGIEHRKIPPEAQVCLAGGGQWSPLSKVDVFHAAVIRSYPPPPPDSQEALRWMEQGFHFPKLAALPSFDFPLEDAPLPSFRLPEPSLDTEDAEMLDAEPVLEAEPVVEPEPVIEPEPEEVLEASPVLEPEPVLEAAPVLEAEVEPELVAEPEPVRAAEPVLEAAHVLVAEPVVEPELVVEPEAVVEPEPVLEAAPVVDAAHIAALEASVLATSGASDDDVDVDIDSDWDTPGESGIDWCDPFASFFLVDGKVELPDESALLRSLEDAAEDTFTDETALWNLALCMAYGSDAVGVAAARTFFELVGNERVAERLEWMQRTLRGSGFVHSGIPVEAGARGVRHLRNSCPPGMLSRLS